MAKLVGPLLSESAHGSMGPRLVYSQRKNVSQVRFQRPQKDYTNANRLAQRVRFWAAIQWWHDLNTNEKAMWNTLAR